MSRDDDRFSRLYREHKVKLARFFHDAGVPRADREELTQITFYTAARNLKDVPHNEQDALRWLLNVAHDAAKNWRCGRRLEHQRRVSVFLVPLADLERDLATREIVLAALDTLAPMDRKLIVKHVLEGETWLEIGSRVLSSRHLLLERIKAALEKLEATLLEIDPSLRTRRN